MATLALAAAERLSDPKVRAQLAEQSRQLAGQVATWRAQRIQDPDRTRSRRLRQLEVRAVKLRGSFSGLARERPERADALAEPMAVLDEVDAAITVADQLPNDKRRQAARRIAEQLDRLEQVAIDVALPG